jgi:hypothetical protein
MTAPPAYVLEEIRRRRESRGPIWNGGALTIAFVAAGFIVASMTLSPVLSPIDVAKAYAEARFARDWSAAWDLLCRPAQAANGDYRAYADSAADGFHFMPWDVDVSTGRMHDVDGSAVAVPVSVSSPELLYEDWKADRDVLVVLEDGKFRVCDRRLLFG